MGSPRILKEKADSIQQQLGVERERFNQMTAPVYAAHTDTEHAGEPKASLDRLKQGQDEMQAFTCEISGTIEKIRLYLSHWDFFRVENVEQVAEVGELKENFGWKGMIAIDPDHPQFRCSQGCCPC